MASRDKVSNQLSEFAAQSPSDEKVVQLTTGTGCPIGDKVNIQTAGKRGPAMLQDLVYLDEMAHFDRERIPERVVHAKGAGAFGYFEVTHDITQYTKAKLFSTIGKKTPVAVRCSTVGGESGSADTVRDPRGFAVKFYTEDGNWDLVGNNTPVFFIRDPFMFPSFIHTQKRNPRTHCKDPDMFWDYLSLRPESIHQVVILFSDRGIPDGYRHMNGYGSHTFKFVNDKDEINYVKFHYKTNQGIKNLPVDKAAQLASSDPDYSIRDLYNAIENGNPPSWTLYIQIMTPDQAENWQFNPFDLTKVWPHADFPLIEVGKIVLDRNPKNYFAEVEQLAFSPGALVPGIEPSPDKVLQGRLFSYDDTHRHRLGTNFLQIPVNCPFSTRVHNTQRDGPMCFNDNQGDAPNYFPNSFGGYVTDKKYKENFGDKYNFHPDIDRWNSEDEDNFTQPGNLYKILTQPEKDRLASNIAGHLKDAQAFIQERAIKNFTAVSADLGAAIKATIKTLNQTKL